MLQDGNPFHDATNTVSDIPRHHVDLILGFFLLQTICVLRGGGQRPVSPNSVHHARLVWVIAPDDQHERLFVIVLKCVYVSKSNVVILTFVSHGNE